MADEPLKRLLDAEAQAERIIARAEEERQQVVEAAKQEILAAEERHAGRVRDMRASFLAQAEQRAQQTITELQRRHAEQADALRAAAANAEQRALDAALEIFIGTPGGAS